MALRGINRAEFHHIQIFRLCEVLYAPFSAGRDIDVSPGRRAKRLPLLLPRLRR